MKTKMPILLCLIALTGCSSRVTDALKKMSALPSLKKEVSIILVSNSTTQAQPSCSQGNSVVLQKSFPGGKRLYCRDQSALSKSVRVGEVCPGGVTIAEITVTTQI